MPAGKRVLDALAADPSREMAAELDSGADRERQGFTKILKIQIGHDVSAY